MADTVSEILERTDYEALQRTPIKVTLGGVELPLTPQPKRQSAKFRHAVAGVLDEIKDVAALADVITKLMSKTRAYELSDLPMERILTMVVDFLGDGGDTALNLIYAYDPAFAEEKAREFIETHATDAEVIAVIARIFEMVFLPLVGALPDAIGVGSRADSSAPSETSANSGEPKANE